MTDRGTNARLRVVMNKFGKYLIVTVISLGLITGSASALTRKTKDTGSTKPKAVDTVKQSAPVGTAVPATPVKVDTSANRKTTPAKFNDFLDKNKNGIDDRVEKCNPENKKTEPAKTAPTTKPAKKPVETKKSISPSSAKISSTKSK